jgi:hypothetical protein
VEERLHRDLEPIRGLLRDLGDQSPKLLHFGEWPIDQFGIVFEQDRVSWSPSSPALEEADFHDSQSP